MFGTTSTNQYDRRSLRFVIAAILAVALSLSLFFALGFSHASADTTTNVTVHSSDVGTSWYSGPPATTRSGGSVSFVTGPAPAPVGNGSLQINTTDANGTSNAKAQLFNYSYVGTKLADVSALSYWDYHASSSTAAWSAQRTSINIEVDFVGDGSSYTTLVYEPYEQGVILQSDTWQFWNTLSGVWWSTKVIPGLPVPQTDTASWSDIVAANPNAKIVGGIGFNAGSGWQGLANNNADALVIGVSGADTAYDFEPTPAHNVEVTVLGSNNQPIAGATIYDQGTYLGSFGPTDANGVASTTLPAGNYSFYATLAGTTSATQGPVAVTASGTTSLTFHTVNAQVELKTCQGTGLAGGVVQYNNGLYTYYLGSPTDANGVASQEIFPGSYLVTMSYQGAANQQTVDFGTTNPYTFATTAVTILNSGVSGYTAPNGYTYPYNGPTMQMLPATYTFNAAGTTFAVNVPADCSGFTGGVVRLIDHNGAGLANGNVSTWYSGAWHNNVATTDANGNAVVSVPDSTTLSIAMTYLGAYNQQNRTQLDASNFTFQTILATVKLNDADGNPLDTGTGVSYYANGWHTFGAGSTLGGQVTQEMLPGSYSFALDYNHTHQQLNGQDVSSPIVFQTGRLTLYYSGTITWNNSQFYAFTQPTMEFLPGPITATFNPTTCKASFTIAAGDHIAKSVIVATLKNSSNANLADGQASAYVGGHWVTFDNATNSNGVACQLFDGQLGNVSVAMVYNGTRQQLPPQNQPTNSIYAFQTTAVTVHLHISTGALSPLSGGDASYYAGGWHTIGTTDTNGNTTVEMLPGSYSFAMSYKGTREQKNGVAVSGPTTTVDYQTVLVTVELCTPDGHCPIADDASFSYYANGWHTEQSTTGRHPFFMLPGSYSFAAVYKGTREQLNGVAVSGVTTTVKFLTTQVHSDSGTADSYYANGWKPFTQDMYLLPGNYWFHFVGGTPPQMNEPLTGGGTSHIY